MSSCPSNRTVFRPSHAIGAGRWLCACLLALFAHSSVVAGQGGPTAFRQGRYIPLDSARELPRVLRAPVTVRAREVPLQEVLESVARQAQLGLSYGEELVQSRTRVTVDVERVSAARALDLAVQGTEWQVLFTGTGQVTVVRRPPATAEASTGVRGVVTASDGSPVHGATVVVAVAGRSAVTDASGRYTISELPPGTHTLRAALPGFGQGARSATVRAGEISTSDLRLAATVVELEEIVAIGYGVARRRDLTGSIASVRPRELTRESVPTTAVSSVLLGRAPGVQVVSNSGTPGASAQLHIRGINSITASPDPLYVVDGIPLSPGSIALSSVDPNNVESVQILKDASATAIYGSRGANGVVLITTRRGVRGSNNVSLESSYGLQWPTRFIPALDAREYRTLVNEGLVNAGEAPRFTAAQIEQAPSFDYPRAILQELRPQPQQNHSATISGGDARTRYLFSGSLLRQEGLVLNSGFQRFGGRVNFDREVSGAFRIGSSLSGTRSTQRVNGAESTTPGSESSGITAAMMYDPAVLPRDPETGAWNQRVVLNENFLNPYTELLHRESPVHNGALLGSVYVEYDLADGLLLRSSAGGTLNFGRNPAFSPSFIGSGNGVGTASVTSSERRELTTEHTLTYRDEVGPGSLEAMVGASLQTSRFEQFTAASRGFPTDQLRYHALGAGSTLIASTSTGSNWALLSQLGRLNYNLLDRYLFTVTARRDGSSRFGANNKWAIFPSAALAWRMIDEPFLRGQTLLSDLKLRLSYGRTGNQAINPYQSLAQLSTVFVAQGTDTDVVALAPTVTAGNPDLRWETQHQYNAGLDVGVLDNRVFLTLDLYQSRTSNLLLSTMLPWTTGFTNQLRNVGAVRNRGLEAGVTTVNWENDDFSWHTSLNLSRNRNQVTELYGGLRNLGAGSGTQVGQPMSTFVGYKVLGLYQQGDECPILNTRECAPGEYKLQDTNGDRVINDNDRVNLGNPQADWYGGFTSNMSFGAVSLDAFFNFSVGNEIQNSSMRYLGLVGGAANERADRALRRWTPTNTNTDVPRANINRPNNRTYSTYIEDGSFLRLQTLSASWRVPDPILPGAGTAYMIVSGQNLWTATRYSGYDPEQQAIDPGGYPRARSWNLGVNLTM